MGEKWRILPLARLLLTVTASMFKIDRNLIESHLIYNDLPCKGQVR